MLLLHEKQKEVALDPHRFRVLCWGRRAGKTELAIDQIKARLVIPNSKVVYVAPTFQQARDIAWEKLRKDLSEAGKPNEARLEIDLVNGSKVALKGWEAIETLRGQHFDLIVLDEVAMFRSFWTNWHEVIRPTLTDTKGEAMFISTPKGFNHFYDLFNLQAKDNDFKSFHASTYDNPFIPKEEIDKAKQELTEDRFAQEYLADFRKSEGLVYKEFNRFRHVFKETPKEGTIVKTFGGHDFGTTNPCATITIKKDKWANYWVVDEYYKTGTTDAQQADYIAALKWDECYPDPESASGILELKSRGVNVRDVVKNKDSIRNGINTIRELFNTNRLRIHESCQNLIWELESYHYPDSKPGHNEQENPVKENDHACFTGDTKIEGEIIHSQSTGFKDVYEFLGSKVTEDHPYLTQRGFVPLNSISYSDNLIIWKNKLLMELPLDDTQSPTGVSLKTILYLLQRNLQAIKQNVSIGIYGKSTMGKYLKAFISTIKITTHLITTYLISNWYHLNGTLNYTIKKTCQSGEETWKLQENTQSCGINQTKQKSFIVGLVKSLGLIKNGIQKNAKNVAGNTKHLSQKEVSFATIIANLKHLGKEEVFAHVSKTGFFTANGVVVSNCDALRYALTMDNSRSYEQILPPIHQIYPITEDKEHNSAE